MTTTPAAPPAERKPFPYVKVIVGVLILAAIIVLFRVLPVAQWLRDFQTYIRGVGPIGYVIYVIVYALTVSLAVPGAAILSAGAGAIFGVIGGTIVVVIGATLGAAIAFLLARTLLRKKVEKMAAGNPKFQNLDRAIGKEGAKIVFLVRLSPVFPFTYVNYLFGLTGIGFVPYVLATFFGIIPGTFAFVYLGSAGAALATGQANKVILIFGVIIAFVVAALIARIAAKSIKRAGVEDQPATTT